MAASKSVKFAAALALAIAVQASLCNGFGFEVQHEMPFGRSDMSVTLHDGGDADGSRIYLVGGCAAHQVCYDASSHFSCVCQGITNKTQYYLPEKDEYVTTTADAPRARYRHAAAEIGGVIYLFGGRDANDTYVVPQVDAYNIEADTWAADDTVCTWPAEMAASDNTAFTDGKHIYLTGGYHGDYTPTSDLLRFDPANCTFTKLAGMAAPRGDVAAFSMAAGGGLPERHFVVGGFGADVCNALKTVESYDVASDTWTKYPDLLLGRADMAAGHLGDTLVVLAGETVNTGCNTSIPVDDVEVYARGRADDSAWVVEEAIPDNRFRFLGMAYKDELLLFGGQGKWVADVDGQGSPGYPILNTTYRYRIPEAATSSKQAPTATPTTGKRGVADTTAATNATANAASTTTNADSTTANSASTTANADSGAVHAAQAAAGVVGAALALAAAAWSV